MQPKQVGDAEPDTDNPGEMRRKFSAAVRPLAICLTRDQHKSWELIKQKLRRKSDEAAFVRLLDSPTMQRIIAEILAEEAQGGAAASGSATPAAELEE